MRRNVQVLLLLLLGASLLHVTVFTDLYLRYVKEGLRPLLVVSAAVLLALGFLGAVRDGFPRERRRATAGPAHPHDHDHGHDHAHVPRVAWLLFPPVLLLVLHAPPALGSFTAAREGGRDAAREEPQAGERGAGQTLRLPPLPNSAPDALALGEFTLRAQMDPASFEGHEVRMTGFVTPGPSPSSWNLTRIAIACCAADSQPVTVRMRGATAPPADTWVTVTGTHRAGTTPTLEVADLEVVEAPPNQYTDTVPPPTS